MPETCGSRLARGQALLLPPRTGRRMFPPHRGPSPAPIAGTAAVRDGLQGRRSPQSPKPCQTSVGTRSGCEADASIPRSPLRLEAQERNYFIQAGASDGVDLGWEARRRPCHSAPSDLPSHEAKPLTLGQEAVSVLFGVLALQLKYKVFEQKDKWICW